LRNATQTGLGLSGSVPTDSRPIRGMAVCARTAAAVAATAPAAAIRMRREIIAKRSSCAVAEHDVEIGGERVRSDLGRRLHWDDEPRPRRRIAYTEQHAVALVLRLAGDIHLRHKPPLPGRYDDEVNMWRPAGIGDRPDRQKLVPTLSIAGGLPETLEILVARPAGIAVPHIVIASVGVTLPDLDPRADDRPSGGIENMPG